MSTSQEQVARLLSLVPFLQARPGVAIADVATAFGVTPKQVVADLKVLYMCGLPGLMPGDLIEIDMEAVEGHGVIHLSNADYLARPLRFTADEVLPLILGLRALREVAAPETVASVDGALAKLEAISGDRAVAAERLTVRVESASEQIRQTIAEALDRRVRLRLVYDSTTTTERLVDPHSVTARDGYAYLEAWSDPPVDSDSPGGWRSFRLDRIAEAELTEITAQPHDSEPAPGGGWLDRLGAGAEVRLELSARAAWVAEYYPVQSVERRDDGGVVVVVTVADPSWLRGLLLRLGDLARVIEPPDAADSARQAAREALAQYAACFGADR